MSDSAASEDEGVEEAVRFESRSHANSLPPSGVLAKELMLAGGIYSLCVAAFFAPTFLGAMDHVIGPPCDNMHYQWVLWWMSNGPALAEHSLSQTQHIFYPEGGTLVYNDSSWFNVGVAIGLAKLLPLPLIYNLLMWSTFVLSALAAYLLIRYLIPNRYAALIGGFVYGFNPSHFAHSQYHLSVSSIQFIPLFFLFFIRCIRRRSRLDTVLAAFFFALSAACNWNYLIFILALMAASYLYLSFRRRQLVLPDPLLRCACICAIALVVLSPLLVPMIKATMASYADTVGGHASGGHGWFIADTAGLLIPGEHQLNGANWLGEKLRARLRGNAWEATVYLGVVNLGILAFALLRGIRIPIRYFAGGTFFLVLAMGKHATFLGRVLPIPLPYTILQHIPIIENVRAPSRWIVMVYLFLSIAVAYAIRALILQYKTSPALRGWMVAGALAIFIDYWAISGETTEVALPQAYDAIAADRAPGEARAILDLPNGFRSHERYMMYQTLHHIPIVQGVLSRKIDKSLQDRLFIDEPIRLHSQLLQHGVTHLVFHKKLEDPDHPLELDDFRDAFPALYEDDDQVVFQVVNAPYLPSPEVVLVRGDSTTNFGASRPPGSDQSPAPASASSSR